MAEIYTYLVELPDSIREAVLPCADGYTVYINAKLTAEGQRMALDHAMRHIRNNDFEKTDVNAIECIAHQRR